MKEEIGKFENYLNRRYPGRSTTKHYVSDLKIFNQTVNVMSARQVTVKTVDAFVQAQSEQGLKPATVNRRLSAVSQFFDYLICESEDDSWRNPVHWKRHGVRAGEHLPRDAKEAQVQQLFEQITDKRDRAMFELMLGAGLRVGEVAQLQMSDVDSSDATHMSRMRVTGKGNKERIVWLTHQVQQHLTAWLSIRPKTSATTVFVNQHKQKLTVSGIQYRFKQYCEQAKVRLSPHQLRHTFARRLVEQGMPVESLARLLGHNQLATTQRYIDGADPTLRADFFQAMANSVPPAPAAPQSSPDPSTVPPEQHSEKRPDAAQLLEQISHLAEGLPQWLTGQLKAHTLRRASRWSDHRLKPQIHHHFSSLCRIGRWFVTERGWQQLDGLKRVDVVAYVHARQAADVKSRSIAAELTLLRMFWRDLLTEELVTNGAILLVKAPQGDDHLPRFLTAEQYQALVDHVEQQTIQQRPQDCFNLTWFYLMAHRGLRLTEVRNLRLDDCDLHHARLTIRSGKGNRDRAIPMTPHLTRIIQAYLAVREPCATNHLLVFRGKPVKSTLLPDRLERWGKAVNITPMTPHRLRHTLATFLVNRGMSIVSLQKFLGHRNINNTLIYARIHDTTVIRQFSSAMAHIERIPAEDWPTHIVQDAKSLEHSVDSV